MDVETLRSSLAWCSVFNLAMLLIWVVVFLAAGDWIRRLHGKWFDLSKQAFDGFHYGGMALYKILIITFNLVPYLVLRLVF